MLRFAFFLLMLSGMAAMSQAMPDEQKAPVDAAVRTLLA